MDPRGLIHGFFGDLHVSVWHEAADRPHVRALRQAVESHSGPCGILLVVPSDTPLSTAAARDEAATMIRELDSRLLGIGIALEGEGFWKAGVRAMFTGIAHAARPRVPWKIFDDPHAASAWIWDVLGETDAVQPDFMSLLHTLESMRAAPLRSSAPPFR